MYSSGRCATAHSLSHFSHTALIVLAVVAALLVASIGGTFAYLTYTTNAVTNELGTGSVGLVITETDGSNNTIEPTNGAATATLGDSTKNVSFTNTGTAAEYIRVSFVPEVEDTIPDTTTNTTSTANVFMDQKWPDTFTDNSMTLGLVTLHFSSDWANYWTYKNGAFISTKPVAADGSIGSLLTGATWTAGATIENDYVMKVNVIAEAIQENAVADAWGIGS